MIRYMGLSAPGSEHAAIGWNMPFVHRSKVRAVKAKHNVQINGILFPSLHRTIYSEPQ